MKYIITGIILLQLSVSSIAQNYTDATADTNINSAKYVAPWFVERFKVYAGSFIPSSNTTISVEHNDGSAGTEIDFENDLGVKRNVASFLADLQWRAKRRSRFDLTYYQVNRNSTYTLQRDLTFGDHTYSVDASVKSYFNTSIFRFSYGYAIFEKPKFELGALVGAHVVGGKAGISLNAENAGGEVSDNFGFTAPLPDFGIWGGYAFSNRFAVNAEGSFLSLTVGDISGRILSYNMLVSYKIIKNLDVALGYTGLNIKVDAVKEIYTGHFKWSYNGPNLSVAFSFGNKYWTHIE